MSFTFDFAEFGPAVEFFRQKANLPTRTWRDLWQGEHARAFSVAGVIRDDMLADFRTAVDAAIAGGETLDAFRKRFDAIVSTYGWQHNGSAGWRSRVIYRTNVRVAYMAGRYGQMTQPDVLQHMPWWQYHHHTILNPREEHKAWNGLVLHHTDPFWRTHYPPNGWGCNCTVSALSNRQLRKLGKSGADPSPGANAGHVSPEWSYNVGEAYVGRPSLPMQGEAAIESGWADLTSGDWISQSRPELVPFDAAVGSPIAGTTTAAELREALVARWGAPRIAQEFERGEFRYAVTLDADDMARYLVTKEPERIPFAGYLQELLTDPFEVYLAFVKSRSTGRVDLRYRIIKAIAPDGDRTRGLVLVANAQKGGMVAWTLVPRSRAKEINSWRRGRLIWARDRDGGY